MTNRSINLIVGLIIGPCALVIFPAAQAGNLEPSGPPAPTMKTLDQIPPTWSQILPADDTGDPCNSARFKCVMGGQAVLDNETGLVWPKYSPTYATDWSHAETGCINTFGGNHGGWRLPTIQELSSLLDISQGVGGTSLKLPSGNPFVNVQTDANYWAVNTSINDSSSAWTLSFVSAYAEPMSKSSQLHPWCVRGGSSVDIQ